MNKVIVFFAFLLLFFSSDPAYAGPLAALVPIVIGAVVKSVILKIILTLVASVALSALQRAMQKKPRPPGIKTERKLTGGVNSRSFILGRYCTAGAEIAPPMSHGNAGKTPNAYLTHVIGISDIPVTGLTGRVVVNGEYIPYNIATGEIGGKYAGHAWVAFYDGTQTAADGWLVSTYGGYVRPWTSDFIGIGEAYAIANWKYNRDIYKSEPEIKFEVDGIKLYDPRKDASVGGVGSHDFSDPSTWSFTLNPVVMIYNILRGIRFADGSKWGGECVAADLPLSNWVAAMNVCDEVITTSVGTEARYRAGYEVAVAEDEPADIIEELLKACSGSMSEIGGIYKIRCGPPSLPVLYVTDDDFLVSRDQDYDPFPGIAKGRNTINASFPSPDEIWNTHDAPQVSDPAYVAQDDGVELPASLSLPTVPYSLQVQRLMLAWLKDDRRWRRHGASLGHYAFVLEPMDVIAWSSARNGYTNKLFELDSTDEDLRTVENLTSLREVDPADHDWSSGDEIPDPTFPPVEALPDTQDVPGLAVSATTITDASGTDRRPAIQVTWDTDSADDALALTIQVRVKATAAMVTEITVTNITNGFQLISEGILSSIQYEVRAKYIVNRPVNWTSWLTVLTPNVLLSATDITGASDIFARVYAAIDASGLIINGQTLASRIAGQLADAQIAALAASKVTGQLSDAQLASIAAAKITGTITASQISNGSISGTKFASGIEPITIVSSIPGSFATQAIFNTADGKLYRWNGLGYVATVATSDLSGMLADAQIAALAASKITGQLSDAQLAALDATKILGQLTDAQLAAIDASKIAGQLTNAQIAAIAAAKITGQLTDAQLATIAATKIIGTLVDSQLAAISAVKVTGTLSDSQLAAISASKITGTITGTQIGANSITTAQIAANTITAADISAGAITSAEIAAGTITAGNIATDTITAGQIAANTITATELSALSVTAGKIAANAVTSNEIAANTIIANDIATGAITATQLAAATITSAQIAAGTITAGNIAASTITGTEIAANTITAADIAAGTITAGNIATGTITATQIAAGAITATQIATGTILAGNIATGTITATQIAAGAITTAKIAAGAVSATTIAAGAVSASKLSAVSDNLFPDPYVKDPSFWSSDPHNTGINIGYLNPGAPQGWYIDGSFPNNAGYTGTDTPWVLYSGAGGFNANPATGYWQVVAPPLRGIKGSQFYQFKGKANNSSNAPLGFTVQWFDNSGAYISANAIKTWAAGEAATADIQIQAPANAVYYRMYCQVNRPGAGYSGAIWFGSWECRDCATGNLLVDGTITGSKIVSDSITAGQIAAGAISVSELAANAVTAGAIAAGSITTIKISAGAVTSNEIAANTILAADIAAATITGTQIAAGTITSANIAAGTIKAGNITAGTITGDRLVANTITSSQLATSGLITVSAQIANGVIVNAQIADATISNAKIADGQITTVKIADAQITNAKIASFSVDTINVINNAITSKFTANTIGGSSVGSAYSSYTTVQSVTAGISNNANIVIVTVSCDIAPSTTGFGSTSCYVKFMVDSNILKEVQLPLSGDPTIKSNFTFTYVGTFSAINHTFSLQVTRTSSSGVTLICSNRVISTIEFKK